MNRETLYRFFYGTATSKEGNEIRKHLEASDENWKEFLRERKLFDALLLNDNLEISGKPHNRNVLSHKFIREAIKVVAIFLFAIGISFLWMQESDNQDSKTVITTLNGLQTERLLRQKQIGQQQKMSIENFRMILRYTQKKRNKSFCRAFRKRRNHMRRQLQQRMSLFIRHKKRLIPQIYQKQRILLLNRQS